MNYRIAYLFSIALLFLSTLTAWGQKSPNRSKQISKLEGTISSIMELANCPGISVAVVEKGQVVYLKGFGYRDYENKKPVTPNTLFAIGSCTKAFTASLVGQLEANKQLEYDASPIKYLPELRFYKSEMNQQIMVRDLLSHNTGVPRHDLSWYFFPSDSRDSLIRRIAHHEPTLAVREGYQYNNFMYTVLGAMTERITNQSWEQNINNKLLSPLGMNRTNLNIDALTKAEDVAFGYTRGEDDAILKEDYYKIRGMAPAGSINSSAQDMAQWVLTWVNGGQYQGKEILPEAFVREAIGSQSVTSKSLPGKYSELHFSNYGFGWSLSSYRSHYRVEHGGNINGFTASTCFFPSDSIGIVVLANQNHSSVPAYVRNTIADKLLGLDPIEWHKNLKKDKKSDQDTEEKVARVSNKIPGTQPTHDLEAYTGSFAHPGYGRVLIALKENRLFAQLPGKRWLARHLHYDIFEVLETEEEYQDSTESSNILLNFRTDEKGAINELTLNLESTLKPIIFERQLEVISLKTGDLEQYTGKYDLGDDVSAEISINNVEQLTLLVPGQPKYTLLPSEEHKFAIKDLDGYSVAFEEKEGTIIAMTFIQPNGSFRVLKK